MFSTAREPQQAPVPPLGCLLLDGEALNWHEYEEDPQQQPWQQQRRLGDDSDSSCSTPSWRASERRQQLPARMSGSCSSPNLVLLADGSHTTPSMQQTLQEYPQQQQQHGSELLPMHSSQSCDSLLALCHTAPSFSTGLGPLGSTAAAAAAAQSTSGSGAAPKSRLGRPTGAETARSLQAQQEQQQEQRQQQQQQSPEASQLTFQQQWQHLQEQAQQRQQQQQLQQQQLLGFSPIGGSTDGATNTSSSSWRQQYCFSPQPQAGGSATAQHDEWPTAVGASSGSARVTSWTFSRCSSGLSLGSEMLARRSSLRVHCVTFNMNGKLPASLPSEMLGECGALLEGTADAGADGSPDLLVFATQVRGLTMARAQVVAGCLCACVGALLCADQAMRAALGQHRAHCLLPTGEQLHV